MLPSTPRFPRERTDGSGCGQVAEPTLARAWTAAASWGGALRSAAALSLPSTDAAEAPAVHLWQQDAAAVHTDQLEALRLVLSTDERQRLVCLRGAAAQRQFIVGRGLLRLLLGSYLDTGPADLVLRAPPGARPQLRRPADTGLSFSVSHSHGLCVFAIARHGTVGVDIERTRSGPLLWDDEHVALVFAPSELDELYRVPRSRRAAAFTAHWTRKEAVLKAFGLGLAVDLAATYLPSDVVIPAVLPTEIKSSSLIKDGREVRGSLVDPDQPLYLQSLTLEDAAYAAAVAVLGSSFVLRHCGPVLA